MSNESPMTIGQCPTSVQVEKGQCPHNVLLWAENERKGERRRGDYRGEKKKEKKRTEKQSKKQKIKTKKKKNTEKKREKILRLRASSLFLSFKKLFYFILMVSG